MQAIEQWQQPAREKTQHRAICENSYTIIIWLVLGAVAGWLAGNIMNTGSGNIVTNIVVGIVGAFLGGWLANMFGFASATGGFSIASIVTAVIGACALLFFLSLIQKGRA